MKKKIVNFLKTNFSGQALDFLPPRKPGLYISYVDFFFFEYHEYPNLLVFYYICQLLLNLLFCNFSRCDSLEIFSE